MTPLAQFHLLLQLSLLFDQSLNLCPDCFSLLNLFQLQEFRFFQQTQVVLPFLLIVVHILPLLHILIILLTPQPSYLLFQPFNRWLNRAQLTLISPQLLLQFFHVFLLLSRPQKHLQIVSGWVQLPLSLILYFPDRFLILTPYLMLLC